MKVFAALLCVSCLVLGVQSVLPHGSDYVGGFLCPLPEFTPPSDSDSPLECPSCIGHDSCEGETMLCCPTAPGCMSCVEGVASDGAGCMTEEEESVDPLSFQLDEEECEICLCLNGDLYCHELEETDSGCANLTEPVEGASCVYEGRNISPGELTRVQHEEECDICFCGNGVLFCRDCGPDVLCEHDGERLGLGETSISDNGCTLCTCLESGEVECVTIDSCVGVCVYNEQELDVGETVQSTDGCNECTCFEDGTVGCTERACVCENGEPLVYCFRSPCDGASCPAYPEATCEDDYCGGCNTRWELEGEDVTDRCFESPGPFEPVRIPTCPATELELCAADCSEDSPCSGDTQLCCGGCCRDPINLPSYEVPPVCPPDIVALSDDSDACDVECQLDDQCPGEKICCRSSCSSSCQYGRIPPNSCEVVREILEERDEAAGEDRVPLGRFLPGCLENGFFSPVQTWENYRWCVNVVTGEPISEAYTSADGAFTCPNCTIDGRTVFPGQSFNDDCNTCFCTDTGLSACTRQFCLDPCSLPVSPGTCEDREMRYFFNSESRLCEQFFYSGCGGNANRFTSAYDCLHACKPESVCLLDWEEGEACDDDADTPARDLFYYYDAEEGECETEVGYRCGGNGNRFQNGMDCLRTCDPDNPGPTDADGNSCWLIQCDIPFCGEGVQPVYSDEYCCPTCPSDVEECEDDDDFMCSDGSCIPEDWVCDGLRDCSDGSDEMGDDCDPSTIHCDFRCSENECVPDNHVCDGVLDCTNARDERGCTDDFVPGLPFYHPPAVCPDSSDNLGPCDISECQSDMECREDREEEDETEDEYEEDNGNDKMCCLNNCNQMSCTRPTTASPACRAVVQRLSANFSYIPQCDADGDYQPVQCTGEGTTRRCWCVNVRSGIPYTTFSSNDDLNCKRCSVGDSDDPMYAPGERYTAEDGCNTCLCTASGVSVCTRKACVEKSCEIGRLTLEHGETKELDCLACSCMYGRLNCSRRECEVEVVRETVQVEMTFSGELPTTEEGLEALERNVERSLLQLYRESMNLDESQVEVTEIREGSVIVVVVLEDTEDDTGANITVLVFQMEEDYNEGLLVIRSDAGEDALVPTEDKFKAETVTLEEEEDDDDDFVWWHGLLIGIAVAAVILSVVFTVIMLFACFRKRDHRVKVDGNIYHEPGTVEKVPLDEKA